MEHAAADLQELTPGAQQILQVASDLFYAHGIHAVGVDTIADESGMTKRTLYNNFGSKDTLVAAYLQDRHSTWWRRLEERLAVATSPRALALFDLYAEDAPHVNRGCAFLNAAAELPADHEAYFTIVYHKRSVEELLRELVVEDKPEHQAPERLARHLFLVLEGAFAHVGIQGQGLITEARETAQELLS